MKSGNIRCALTGAYALGSWLLWTGSAPAQAPLYQDKTITVVVATDAGGTADLRIRTVVASLRKHIPGNPTIVVEYMPAAADARRQIMSLERPAPMASRWAPCSRL